MKYFKNSNDDLFLDPIETNHNNLVEITENEFKQLTDEINTPTAEEEIKKQIEEAKDFLNNTDYINNKYNDEVTVLGTSSKADFVLEHKELYLERAEKRAFIQENEIKI